MFGGIPATGAIARTATNIRSGATSPVAGIVHALTLLAIVLVAAPLARFIPLPTLAAILMIVAYRMGEWHEIPSILRLSAADRVVWAATFALTVFADLTVAVEVGMLLAALLFIHSVAADDHGRFRHRRNPGRRRTTRANRQIHSVLLLGDSHPRAVLVRRNRKAGARNRRCIEIRHRRRPENDVHVGHRRHRHPRVGKPGQTLAKRRSLARDLRRPATAAGANQAIEAFETSRQRATSSHI